MNDTVKIVAGWMICLPLAALLFVGYAAFRVVDIAVDLFFPEEFPS